MSDFVLWFFLNMPILLNLKPGSLTAQVVLSLVRIALITCGILCLHMNYRIDFLSLLLCRMPLEYRHGGITLV